MSEQRPAVTVDQLLYIPLTPDKTTELGLRSNIDVDQRYIGAWPGEKGVVAINNLMEGAATAAISRSQVWQWVLGKVVPDTGVQITAELIQDLVAQECATLRAETGERAFTVGHWSTARDLFLRSALAEDFVEFLTLPAYDLVLERTAET